MSEGFAAYPSLRDRVVFITGGASGIGAEHVTQFAAQEAKVAFVDIADDAAQALIDKIEAAGSPKPFYQHCDLKDIVALQATIAEVGRRLGPITVLVNNAANDQRHKFEDVTVEYLGRADGDQSAAPVLCHPGHGADDAVRRWRVDHQFRLGKLAFTTGGHAGLYDGKGRRGGADAWHGA